MAIVIATFFVEKNKKAHFLENLIQLESAGRFDISYAVNVPDKIGAHEKKLQVPIIQSGKVTIEEIDSLIEALCSILEDEFGVKVVVELKEFQRRVHIITEYVLTPLRLLSIHIPNDIFNEISDNREQKFQELDRKSQDFKSIGGILSRQGRPFTITPKKKQKVKMFAK